MDTPQEQRPNIRKAPIIIVTAFIVLAVVAFAWSRRNTRPGPVPTPASMEETITEPASADASVDAAINAILSGSSGEASQLSADADADAATVGADSAAMGDFGTSFDDNDL